MQYCRQMVMALIVLLLWGACLAPAQAGKKEHEKNGKKINAVSLSVDGVAKKDKTTVGKYIYYNEDNRDPLPTPGTTPPPSSKPQELVKCTVHYEPADAKVGLLVLSVDLAKKIALWRNADRTQSIGLPKTWDLAKDNIPATFDVYIEGIGSSTAVKDLTLTLEYKADGKTVAKSDTVKLTVVCAIVEPDDGQVGVNGDSVPSMNPKGMKHYVSPKDAAGSMVTLKTTMAPATLKFEDYFTWDGGIAVAGTPGKCTVSRGTAAKTIACAKNKTTNVKHDRVCVWVVWAEFDTTVKVTTPITTPIMGSITVTRRGSIAPPMVITFQSGITIYSEIKPKCSIEPSDIIIDKDKLKSTDPMPDIPNLDGKPLKPDLPGVYTDGTHVIPLQGGVEHRWDISRRKATACTVTGIVTPLPIDATAGFPADSVTGNDDPVVSTQDNNPYSGKDYKTFTNPVNKKVITVQGKVDELVSYDTPSRSGILGNTANIPFGNIGDTYEVKKDFQEFARVQLGKPGTAVWYVISDPFQWGIDYKFKAKALTEISLGIDVDGDGHLFSNITEAFMGQDYDGDGRKATDVTYWDDNGSTSYPN